MPTVVTKTVRGDGTGDYTTLSAWNAGEQANLVALDQIREAEVYNGLTPGNTNIDGWTTDENRFVRIRAAASERHAGVWDETSARLVGSAGYALGVACHVHVEGMLAASTSPSTTIGPFSLQTGGYLTLIGCVAKTYYTNGAGGRIVTLNSSTSYAPNGPHSVRAINCLFYGARSAIEEATYRQHRILMANCTCVNRLAAQSTIGDRSGTSNAYGLNVGSQYGANLTLYNNTFVGYRTDIRSTWPAYQGTGANLTSDATSPDGAAWQNQVPVFTDPLAGDFSLTKTDTAARDRGVDLSAHAAVQFSTDIRGIARPQGAAWDVGAFEVAVYVTKETGGASAGTSSASARAVRVGRTGAAAAGTSSASARAIRVQSVGASTTGASTASITRTIRIQQTGAEAHGTSYAYAYAQRQAEERPTGASAHGTSFASIGAVVIIQHKPTGATAAGSSTASIERTIRIQGVGAEAAGTAEAIARGVLVKIAGGAAAGTSLAEILGTALVLGQRIVLRGSGPTARLVVYGGGRAEEIGTEGLVVPGSDGASYRLYVSEAGEPLLERV